MSPIDVSPFSDRFQFDAAVRSRSWEWLLALRRRLNIDLQIVNDAQAPLLGPAASPVSTNIEALLASGAPGLRLALSTAMRTRTPQAASVERIQTVCLPLSMGQAVGGVLVLARRTTEDVSPERARRELELIGFWLSNAIEAHLAIPPAAEGDLDRLSSLCRLLGDAAAHGSDREIVAAFAETLAVWHDLEAYGYIETSRGDFLREVSLAGADPSRSPTVIQRASLPEEIHVTRLSKPDIERLGFSTAEDLLVTKIGDGTGSWLLVIAGSIASHEVTRLGLYLALLDQAIARAIDASTAHVVGAMARHLLDAEEQPEEQARRAVVEMQEALGVSMAALTVTTVAGAPLVGIGSAPAAAAPGEPDDGSQLVIVRRAPGKYTMALAVGWSTGRRVTRQEHRVAHASADLLESWVRRIVRQSKDAGERRASPRSYDEVLERFARQALEAGVPVTAVVLSFDDAVLRPGITQARIGRIREQVRAADLVGRLGEGEIGMLLHDTPGGAARAMMARLRRALQTADNAAAPVPVSVGFASRDPGAAMAGTLAQEARENALHDAHES